MLDGFPSKIIISANILRIELDGMKAMFINLVILVIYLFSYSKLVVGNMV